MRNAPQPPDTIDLGEVLLTLARGWVWILGGILFGGIVAGLVNRFGPLRYETSATVVLRDRTEAASGQLAMGGALMEGMADLFSLPGQMGSMVDTEVEILQGRDLLNKISDRVGLQIQVRSPRGVAPDSLFSLMRVDLVREKAEYTFRRAGDAYRVDGEGAGFSVHPGDRVELPGATLVLAGSGLPETFKIRILDRQDVVDRILRKNLLSAELLGGDLAEVTFIARNPVTAARGVNTAIETYLRERRGRIRGVTSNRLGVLTHLADSLQNELSRATTEYREYQEVERAFDPERLGELERAAELRAQVDALVVEARSLDEVLGRMQGGSTAATDILAYPSFLRSDAINDVLDRIFTLQSEKIQLLKRRTERDPDVVLLQETVDYLTGELLALASSYRSGLQLQLDELGRELQEYRADFAARPQQEERAFELEKEVERLTASYLGVQGQLVQVRLAGIGEGADLRQVDVAPPPKKPAFPIWWLNLGIGLLVGAILGMVAALLANTLSPVVRTVSDLRWAHNLPVVELKTPSEPLILRGLSENGSLLLLPLPGVDDPGRWVEGVLERGEGRAVLLTGPEDPTLPGRLNEGVVLPLIGKGRTSRRDIADTLEALAVLGAKVPAVLLLGR